MSKNQGGRPATGSPKWRLNPKTGAYQWFVRVTLADGSRPFVELDPSITESEADRARTAGREVSALARTSGAVATKTKETVAEWSKRWLSHLDARGYATVADIRSRLNRMMGLIGPLDVTRVSPAQIEDVRDMLDREVASGAISWKTAFHHWSDVKCMFRDAVSSKDRKLRVRTDDPTIGIRPPEKGADKAKTVLYGDEVARLLASPEVPIAYRILYAVAVYTGLRAGELEALDVGDVDLEHGMIRIDKAVSRKTGEVSTTKTEHTGDVPIEPALLPLVTALVEGRPADARLLWMPVDEDRAERFRAHLKRAKVDRPALYADDARHKPIWFHDTRSTHLTWRAIRGDSAAVIQAVARHTSFQTTLGYINAATLLRHRGVEVFPAVPAELVEAAPGFGSVLPRGKTKKEKPRKSEAFWRPQRELNPCYRRERPVS